MTSGGPVCVFVCVVSLLVPVSASFFTCLTLIVCLSAFLCVCVFVCDASVPDGSGKKNFSGEARTRDRSQRASSDPQLKDLCGSHTLEQTVGAAHARTHTRAFTVRLVMSHGVISCK